MHNYLRWSLLIVAICGCQRDTRPMDQPIFQFTVEEVFYIGPPVDRVMLVGTVQTGTVRPGDNATVECKGGVVSVVVESIEAYSKGEIKQADKGDQVALKLRGIARGQANRGDRVMGNSGG